MTNRMDNKVEVEGKTKMYHANLLKRYYGREEDLAGVGIEEIDEMAGVAVIDLEDEEIEELSDEDQNLLELNPLGSKET